MMDLANNKSAEDSKKFPEVYFTIKHHEMFWSDVWTDMALEQSLMRNAETIGGLTREFVNWLKDHNHFGQMIDKLASLSSAVVGDTSITCDMVVEKGMDTMKSLYGKMFADVVPRKQDYGPWQQLLLP
ncbi:hypothetical protein PR048_025441 [Dryococelus australis]|uniref:Uncharacterized protein n=1 Tax=Dryococelus australis TaxID=614101 RepID=A0ABQ9GRE0_9NEOP|nr:hypothetical protein PR048_025441 [Dryococelus australis]